MKRLISIALATLIIASSCMLFSSCSGGEKIELTIENINDYFVINSYAENYEQWKDSFGISHASCNWTIEIMPTEKIKAENVHVKLEVKPSTWTANEIKKDESGTTYVDITIPSGGEIKKVIQCSYSSVWAFYPNDPSCVVLDVSGTIIK